MVDREVDAALVLENIKERFALQRRLVVELIKSGHKEQARAAQDLLFNQITALGRLHRKAAANPVA